MLICIGLLLIASSGLIQAGTIEHTHSDTWFEYKSPEKEYIPESEEVEKYDALNSNLVEEYEPENSEPDTEFYPTPAVSPPHEDYPSPPPPHESAEYPPPPYEDDEDSEYPVQDERLAKAASELGAYEEWMTQFYEKKYASIFYDDYGRGQDGDYPPANEEGTRHMRMYGEDDITAYPYEPLLHINTTALSYGVLSKSPHGRHLLLITLLEGFNTNYWEPRCGSYIKMYLPNSLKSPEQPEPPQDACILQQVKLNGKVATRDEIVKMFQARFQSKLSRNSPYSRFQMEDVVAVNALVKFVLEQDSFDACVSLLLVIKDYCNQDAFIEAVYIIIQARSDVGFILPSLFSVNPTNFFPGFEGDFEDDYNGTYPENYRHPKQAWRNRGRGNQGNNRISFRTTYRTYTPNNPEFYTWHFREDCLLNSMHSTWHILLNGNIARQMRRRGELFYHMHKQMINRYNADRIAAGMGVVIPYGENDWGRPLHPGYNSNLGRIPGTRAFGARPAGATLGARERRQLRTTSNTLDRAIRTMRINYNRQMRSIGYANGQDRGISPLANVVEAFGPNSNNYGNIHNTGHGMIAAMGGGSSGVMGFTSTGIRDPLFFRWHKFVDDFFSSYKRNLGSYGNELEFDDVTVTDISLRSDRGNGANILNTYNEWAQFRLDQTLTRTRRGGSVYEYERLNHDSFTYTIRIDSDYEGGAVGRTFLVPVGNYQANDVFIEMDKFYIQLTRGQNTITRDSGDAPHLADAPPDLPSLQDYLMRGISEAQFNWGNCGLPQNLALPRGTPEGMRFHLVFLVTRLLDSDRQTIGEWNRHSRSSWTWCGVTPGQGTVPDTRPMGFPFDRPTTTLNSVVNRSNGFSRQITIRYSGN